MKQLLNKAITHAAAETMKAAVQTMAVAMSEGSSGARSEPISIIPKLGGPGLKQPCSTGKQQTNTFNSKALIFQIIHCK